MTPIEAERIFAAYGVEAARLDESNLHRAWIRVARRVHPDSGGAHDAAAFLNAAYSVLKEHAQSAREVARQRPVFRDPKRDGISVWAWAGASGTIPSDRIERASLEDRNYVKRRLWELSDGSHEEWTVWPFDGRGFLRPLTAYASTAQFEEMVVAANHFAREGFRRPVAVLASRSGDRHEAHIIGLRGYPLPRPERLTVAGPPPSDHALVRGLQVRLAR